MSSLVRDLQRDILNSSKSTTEILRTAKLISAKLGLTDISEFIDAELNGYKSTNKPVPDYRYTAGGTLHVHNPVRGWQMAGNVQESYSLAFPISEIESLSKGQQCHFPPPSHIPVQGLGGGNYMVNQWSQRIVISSNQLTRILEAVKNEILNWTVELEKRGILGEDMGFDEQEMKAATSQTFHIQKFTGIIGNVSHSNVQLYDYSSIHQTLKESGVPQSERNALENIMDELAKATPAQNPSLIEKAKGWVVKNKDFLGASVEIVRKSLGLE
jgi:AbiTii